MWMIYEVISKFLNILFPLSCIKCKKEGNSFCEQCLSLCKKSLDTPALYHISIYSFKDPYIKKAIHAIKYFHKKDLISSLTYDLSLKIQEEIRKHPENIPWILVPIPMPRLRKYMRGYNQTELIAEEIAKHIPHTKVICALKRNKASKRQVTTKTRSERLQNQQGAFKTSINIKDKYIILIDDVTTTGATLLEARKTLLKSGARKVYTATIAH